MKKDFTANVNPVYEMIETATQEAPEMPEAQGAQEAQEIIDDIEAPEQLTQADKPETIRKTRKALKELEDKKKKARGKRINVSLDEESFDYIKIMAKVTGYSMPEFINVIIRKSMEKNAGMYKLAKNFRDDLE